ncbi:MAG: HRDC domain-containing protein [Myxococcales bacterium]|nr:HRDC domain-containing protein [Myxococcales bacterium]MBL0196642.1 HRDC domain-containing protein [Myxococcales bacterium]HQY63194.1 HRDC domain-containing protein [Polyangiaceae bacterium]
MPSSEPPNAPVTPRVHLAEDTASLRAWCARLRDEPILALDVESNGLFAFEPELCVVQLSTRGDVVVVDTLVADPSCLADLIGPGGPLVVLHDLGFDARMLSRAGAPLHRVADTALAAAFLGRSSTGLGAVLASELGVDHDKTLQHHDWRARPLDARALRYLSGDVAHLLPLWDKLSAEVAAKGIASELAEETRHRLAEAQAPAEDARPPLLRVKGVDRLPVADLPLLRALLEARDDLARQLDVPPFKVLANDALVAAAQRRPRSVGELARIDGAHRGRARALSRRMLELVGEEHPPLTPEERAGLSPPRPSPAHVKARKRREGALLAWRKAEAARRDVNAQVVLPGHVLRALADGGAVSTRDLAAVSGLGDFRVERYGDALLALLAEPEPGPS